MKWFSHLTGPLLDFSTHHTHTHARTHTANRDGYTAWGGAGGRGSIQLLPQSFCRRCRLKALTVAALVAAQDDFSWGYRCFQYQSPITFLQCLLLKVWLILPWESFCIPLNYVMWPWEPVCRCPGKMSRKTSWRNFRAGRNSGPAQPAPWVVGELCAPKREDRGKRAEVPKSDYIHLNAKKCPE